VSASTIDIGGMRIRLTGLDEGLGVAVRARYVRFLTEESPDFEIAVAIAGPAAPHQPDDMPEVVRVRPRAYRVAYGALTAELDFAAGRGSATVLSTVYIVDSLLRIVITLLALERDALLIHGSGVRVGDRALVCFGPSGVGKTTVARSVDRKDVLCDEMMLLYADGDGVRVASTPFHGDLGFCQPGTAPLYALVRLRHGERDRAEPLSAGQAAHTLLNSVLFFCKDEALADSLLGLALRISNGRTYSLTFRRETHVPTFIHAALQ
jgi:hypothetical protein